MSALVSRLQIRHVLVALLALPALYLTFIFYRSGNVWIALALLAVTWLGVFIYLNPSASTFRYLFPGFIGFGLFVIFPLVYTVYIGFTKYSSQNLLHFDRSAALIRNETFLSPNAASYKYKLYPQKEAAMSYIWRTKRTPHGVSCRNPLSLRQGRNPRPNRNRSS